MIYSIENSGEIKQYDNKSLTGANELNRGEVVGQNIEVVSVVWTHLKF